MIADDKMNYFLHFYMKAFRELEDNTVSTFCFCFFNFVLFFACLLFFFFFFKDGRVLKLCAKTLYFSKGNQRPEK